MSKLSTSAVEVVVAKCSCTVIRHNRAILPPLYFILRCGVHYFWYFCIFVFLVVSVNEIWHGLAAETWNKLDPHDSAGAACPWKRPPGCCFVSLFTPSLHLLEHSTQRHSICPISFFLSPAAEDIPVSSILPWHYPLIFCTAHSWTSQQFRLF